MKTIYQFRDSEICLIGQNGEQLSKKQRGVTVYIDPKNTPPKYCEVYSTNCDNYTEIGWPINLKWEGTTLVDFSGVFELPREVIAILKELGYTMGEGIEA